MEIKEEAVSTFKEIIIGLGKSPYTLLIFLLVMISVGFSSFITYIVLQNSDHNSKYFSDSLTHQFEVANQQVKQFNENISVTNTVISQIKEQFSDFKIMQVELQNSIKDHEKRLTKIEVKENIK